MHGEERAATIATFIDAPISTTGTTDDKYAPETLAAAVFDERQQQEQQQQEVEEGLALSAAQGRTLLQSQSGYTGRRRSRSHIRAPRSLCMPAPSPSSAHTFCRPSPHILLSTTHPLSCPPSQPFHAGCYRWADVPMIGAETTQVNLEWGCEWGLSGAQVGQF